MNNITKQIKIPPGFEEEYLYNSVNSSKKIKQTYFPPGIEREKIKFTDEALYSVSHWRDAEVIVDFITSIFDVKTRKNITVVDGTACIGGNTIIFSKNMKNVIAIDNKKEHIEILKHNMELYNAQNIEYIVGDITVLANKYCNVKDSDKTLLFVDPPWGGPDYKESELSEIYLSNISIRKLTQEWIEYYDVIVLKLPKTYDVDGFCRFISRSDLIVDVWKMYKYPCIAIYKVHMSINSPPLISQPF